MKPPEDAVSTAAHRPGVETPAVDSSPHREHMTGPIIEVLAVSHPEGKPGQLRDFSLDEPTAGSRREKFALRLSGWVLGKQSRATAVQVFYGGTLLRTLPLDYPRRGLAENHPGLAEEDARGFKGLVGVIGLSPEFELTLRAVLENGDSVPFASIRARHKPITPAFEPHLRPIILTSLPRTGTTRMMRMMAVHPGIVVYRHFPYEHNSAEYWTQMMKVLAEPGNTVESSGRDFRNLWWVGSNPFYNRHVDEDEELATWFEKTYVERLATFCQRSIDDWYRTVARRQGQEEASYFAEKHRPGQIPTLLWELYPDAKEICLVRDPRDMVCSVLSFWRKGEGARARGEDDHELIQTLGASVRELYDDWTARASRSHLLRYEDSVLSPADTLRGMLEYLEVDSSPSIVKQMLDAADEGTPQNFPQHQTSGAPEASIGRWRRDLDPALQEACDEAFAPVLDGFGYSQ
jgi:hypothetical protein